MRNPGYGRADTIVIAGVGLSQFSDKPFVRSRHKSDRTNRIKKAYARPTTENTAKSKQMASTEGKRLWRGN